MTPRGLLVFGFGGHARSVADVAIACGVVELLFVDDHARPGESFLGFAAVARMPDRIADGWSSFPASGDAVRRTAQIGAAARARWPVATLVSPRAYVAPTATVGSGVLVAHGAHVGPLARVATGCIVNTHAVIEHECSVGEFAHVAVNATIAGRCRVGARTMVGAGATVLDGITIGDDVTVGAGAVVAADLPDAGVYVGVPARRSPPAVARRGRP